MSEEVAVSIVGLDKAAVLAALYNAAAPHRMGFLQYDPAPMTMEQARSVLAHRDPDDQMIIQARRMGLTPAHPGWEWASHCFYYLKGRALPVDISGDSLDAHKYDEKHGAGAAQQAICVLRATGDVSDVTIRRTHLNRTVRQARIAIGELGQARNAHARRLRAILEPILRRSGQ